MNPSKGSAYEGEWGGCPEVQYDKDENAITGITWPSGC